MFPLNSAGHADGRNEPCLRWSFPHEYKRTKNKEAIEIKKISRRRFLQITGISAAAVGLNACGGSSGSTAGTAASGSASAAPAADGKKYTLRASSNQAATSTIGMALAKFVELVNEKSAGRIKATANYGSELGSQSEQVAMAIAGDLELVLSTPGTGPGAYDGLEQMQMFEFPFLFEDNDQYRRVLKGAEDQVNELANTIGLSGMGGMSMGSRDMLTTVPVKTLADMKDLVMRGPNAIYNGMFECLGAAGITMDWNDIYTSLSQNVCQGCEGSPVMLNASKLQDNAKYLAITNHIIACVYFFFNTDWLESLPEDVRTLVTDCVKEAVDYQESIDDDAQKDALEQMKKDGVEVTEPADIQAWKDACAPMLDEYRAKGDAWAKFTDLLLSIK